MESSKTALVLSGGGSRGAYEIGVWQALSELGEQIDIVTGTSVGAINGAVIASGKMEQAQQLWKELETSRIFDLELEKDFPDTLKRLQAFTAFSKAAARQGGAGTKALSLLLRQYIEEPAVYASPVELGIVTCRLENLQPVYVWKEQMGEGRLHDYLLASSALFPAIQPHSIDDIRYVDGGYADNMPIKMALEKAATRVFAVNMRAIGLTHAIPTQKGVRITEIKPYWDLGALLLFDPTAARQNMRLGYLDTMKACGVFDGVAYTFLKGVSNKLARRYAGFYELFGQLIGLGAQGGFLEAAACAPLQKRVRARLRTTRVCTVSGLALEGAETAGELFSLDPCLLYSLDRFDERLRQAVASAEDAACDRVRTIVRTATAALAGKGSAALFSALALHPAEFSAALYLVTAGLMQ